MRLDQHRPHTCVLGCPREFQVVEAPPIDVGSAVHVQIHGPLKIVRQKTHTITCSPDSVLAIHPASADSAAAIATALMGIAKLAVCRVTRPTAHMARAPASEPQPLRIPIAVDTCVPDTSCAIVKYTATQIPRPKLTNTSEVTAPDIGRIGTAAQQTTATVATRKTI